MRWQNKGGQRRQADETHKTSCCELFAVVGIVSGVSFPFVGSLVGAGPIVSVFVVCDEPM